jgi:hypothetical protein
MEEAAFLAEMRARRGAPPRRAALRALNPAPACAASRTGTKSVSGAPRCISVAESAGASGWERAHMTRFNIAKSAGMRGRAESWRETTVPAGSTTSGFVLYACGRTRSGNREGTTPRRGLCSSGTDVRITGPVTPGAGLHSSDYSRTSSERRALARIGTSMAATSIRPFRRASVHGQGAARRFDGLMMPHFPIDGDRVSPGRAASLSAKRSGSTRRRVPEAVRITLASAAVMTLPGASFAPERQRIRNDAGLEGAMCDVGFARWRILRLRKARALHDKPSTVPWRRRGSPKNSLA